MKVVISWKSLLRKILNTKMGQIKIIKNRIDGTWIWQKLWWSYINLWKLGNTGFMEKVYILVAKFRYLLAEVTFLRRDSAMLSWNYSVYTDSPFLLESPSWALERSGSHTGRAACGVGSLLLSFSSSASVINNGNKRHFSLTD